MLCYGVLRTRDATLERRIGRPNVFSEALVLFFPLGGPGETFWLLGVARGSFITRVSLDRIVYSTSWRKASH